MGLFDLRCAESDLALRGPTTMLLLLRDGARWVPAALPFVGTYDRLGGIEEADTDEPSWELLDSATYQEGLRREGYFEDLVHGLFQAPARWKRRPLGYALFDAAIFEAMAASVASGEKAGEAGLSTEALGARPWEALLERAFPLEVSRALYAGSDELRPRLIQLIQALAWATPLTRFSTETPGGQYGGLRPTAPDDTGATLPLVLRARARYAGFPRMLEAVLSNADRWAETDEPGDEEESDGFAPAPVPVGGLLFCRTFTGDWQLQVPRRQAGCVSGWLRKRLAERRQGVTFDGTSKVRCVPAETSAWAQAADGLITIQCAPALVEELLAALQGAQPTPLSELPGVWLSL